MDAPRALGTLAGVRSAVALICVLMAAPTAALGQPRAPAAPSLTGAWADTLDPNRRDARRLVRQGLFLLLSALHQRSGRGSAFDDPPHRLLDRALLRLTRAQLALPDDPDLAFYIAQALSSWERPGRDGGTELRVEDAVAAWQRLRALDPDYMPARVALALASLHFRRLELEQAAAEYEIALDRAIPEAVVLMGRTYMPSPLEIRLLGLYQEVDPPMIHANLAENRMLLGQLDEAARDYRIAIESARDPISSTLARWGLALTLHRADDHEASLAAASDAIDADPLAGVPERNHLQRRWGAFAALHDANVFFEPAYEIHAYHAVGYEAFAQRPGVDAHAAVRNALTSWRRFLAEGGTTSRFGPHARAQVRRLEATLEALPDATGSARPSVDLSVGRRRGRVLRDASARVWLPL